MAASGSLGWKGNNSGELQGSVPDNPSKFLFGYNVVLAFHLESYLR